MTNLPPIEVPSLAAFINIAWVAPGTGSRPAHYSQGGSATNVLGTSSRATA